MTFFRNIVYLLPCSVICANDTTRAQITIFSQKVMSLSLLSTLIITLISIYRRGEEKLIEKYKARISVTEHTTKQGIDKHLTDFPGLKEQPSKLDLGSFHPKLYRPVKGNGKTENFSILTQQQLYLELPQILAGESDSELNDEYTFHSRLTLNLSRWMNLKVTRTVGRIQNMDPRSMDHPCGPGPWTTSLDPVHGPLH